MRGKEISNDFYNRHCGITPAYAGKSRNVSTAKQMDWDHPRQCGEKYGYYTIEVISLGSPPPMRGKETFPEYRYPYMRITPAYAGKRSMDLPFDTIV